MQYHTKNEGVHILCIQETHESGSEFYVTDDGYLAILSGGTDAREHAGVGFILSPSTRRCLIGFRQATSRWASLKMTVPGGKTYVVSAYCPRSGYSLGDRQQFYSELGIYIRKLTCNGPKLVVGDFNAKLYRRFPTEHDIIGPQVYPSASRIDNVQLNRHLLYELCVAHSMVISNTFFEQPPEKQVTC